MATPNHLLRDARRRRGSPGGSGRELSRQELAELINASLDELSGRPGILDATYIGKLERGEHRWPAAHYREAFRAVLDVRADADLGFYVTRRASTASARQVVDVLASVPVGAEAGYGQDVGLHTGSPVLPRGGDDVQRRGFLTASALMILDCPAGWTDELFPTWSAGLERPAGTMLTAAAADIKRAYQACRYRDLTSGLPQLLSLLRRVEAEAGGGQEHQVNEAGVHIYHVLGSVLLKLGDPALALLAAERSTRYAAACGDWLTPAISARILTHALSSNGHHDAAVLAARRSAQQLEADRGFMTDDGLSVYGALVLRAAVAAASAGDYAVARDLMRDAARAGTLFGRDANVQWTGFGPTNVLLHEVNVALRLGDAGTALSIAARIDARAVDLPERRACLQIDIASAHTQLGNNEQALTSLEQARAIAPQELRNRNAHKVFTQLRAVARGPVLDHVARFGRDAGIAA